jgi:hypothetical protein
MKKTIPIKVAHVEITPENKCSFCKGSKCCSYITHMIETPKRKTDFDYLLWQVSHKNVRVYKDEDGWFLLVDNACNHLLPDGRCGIYEVRPAVCRAHTNDYCEYDSSAEEGFELYFDGYESLLAYCKKRFKKWDAWKAKQAAEG